MFRIALFLFATVIALQSVISQQLDFEKLDGPYGGPIAFVVPLDTALLIAKGHIGAHLYITSNQGRHWNRIRTQPWNTNLKGAWKLNDGSIVGTIGGSSSSIPDTLIITADTGRSWNRLNIGTPWQWSWWTGVNHLLELSNGSIVIRTHTAGTYGDSLFLSNDRLTSAQNVTPNKTAGQNNNRDEYTFSNVHETKWHSNFVGYGSTLYRSKDGCHSWDSVATFYDSTTSNALFISDVASNDGKVYLLVKDRTSKMYISTDDGLTWKEEGPEFGNMHIAYRMYFSGDRIFCRSNYAVYIMDIAHNTWEKVDAPDGAYGIHCAQNDVLYTWGSFGFATSTDWGASWHRKQEGMTEYSFYQLLAEDSQILAIHTGIFDYQPLTASDPESKFYSYSADSGHTWDAPSPFTQNMRIVSVPPNGGSNYRVAGPATMTSEYFFLGNGTSISRINKSTGSLDSFAVDSRMMRLLYHEASESILVNFGDDTIHIYDAQSLNSIPLSVPMPSGRSENVFQTSDGRIIVITFEGRLDDLLPYSIYEYGPDIYALKLLTTVDGRFSTTYSWSDYYLPRRNIDSHNRFYTQRFKYVGTYGHSFWIDISDDLGQSWKSYHMDQGEGITCIFIDSKDIAWLGTDRRLLYSTNGGYSWEESGLSTAITTITESSDGSLLIGTDKNGIYRTTPNLQYVVSTDEIPAATDGIALSQNYPNPVTGSTTIPCSLGDASDVTLEVYNTLGRKVATVLQSRAESGTHSIPFDASGLTPGMYRYVLRSSEGMHSKWMTVVK